MTVLDRLTSALEALLALVLFGMFLMIATLVVLRYVFATTIIGGNEATIVAFIFTTAIGSSLAIARDEHIAIDFFVGRMSPEIRRTLARVRLALLALLNAVLVVYAVIWIRATGGFTMPTLGVPQLVAQASVPLGSGLCVLYCIARLVR